MLNYGAVSRGRDDGGTPATATVLPQAMTFSASGVIERSSHVDAFQFQSGPGPISITVALSDPSPNLDLRARIYNSAGNLVASADSTTLGVTLTATVPYGTYFLMLEGV